MPRHDVEGALAAPPLPPWASNDDADDDGRHRHQRPRGQEPPVRSQVGDHFLTRDQQVLGVRHGGETRPADRRATGSAGRGQPYPRLVEAVVVDAEVVGDLVDDGDADCSTTAASSAHIAQMGGR